MLVNTYMVDKQNKIMETSFDSATFAVKSSGGLKTFKKVCENIVVQVRNCPVPSIDLLQYVYFGGLSQLSPTTERHETWLRTGNLSDFITGAKNSWKFMVYLFLNAEGTEKSLLEQVKNVISDQPDIEMVNKKVGDNKDFIAYYLITFGLVDQAPWKAHVSFQRGTGIYNHCESAIWNFTNLHKVKKKIEYYIGDDKHANAKVYLEQIEERNAELKIQASVDKITDVLNEMNLNEDQKKVVLALAMAPYNKL